MIWDDGTKTNQVFAAGPAGINIDNNYALIAQRKVGSNCVFNTTVRLYNATGALLGTRIEQVTIPAYK